MQSVFGSPRESQKVSTLESRPMVGANGKFLSHSDSAESRARSIGVSGSQSSRVAAWICCGQAPDKRMFGNLRLFFRVVVAF
jgi:hypothetical protein